MPRVAVLGGGVAGLAAAHRLHELARERSDFSFSVFERDTQPGGCVRTVREDGALLELGADSLLTGKPAIARLLERLNLASDIVDQRPEYRGARILHNGKLRPIPPEFRLFAPRSLPALARSGIFSPRGLLRAALEPLVPPRKTSGDETLASFVTRRLGREVLERLAQPLIGGIYSADPRELSMDMALPQFLEYERRYGSLLRAMQRATQPPAPRLASLRGGLGSLVDALRSKIESQLRTNQPVEDLAFSDTWRIRAGGQDEAFDAIVCALPANEAARLLQPIDADLSAGFASIRCNRIATINLMYADEQASLPAATGFVVPFCEGRAITAATFTTQKYPGRTQPGTMALRAFIGGALQPELLARSDDELAALAHAELQAIAGVRGAPKRSIVTRWDNLPQYGVGHRQKVEALQQRAARLPGLALAGCAMQGVGIPDCVASGEAAAESVFGYLVGAKGAST